jgi:type I restriction enzyme, S subunit
MFGDPSTNSKRWKIIKCSEMCSRVTVGVVVRPASYYRSEGVPAVRGTNIKPDGIDLDDVVYFSEHDNETTLSKSRIWAGDLLVVRTGRPGLAALVPDSLDGANAIDVIIATPDVRLVRPVFLLELLNSDSGRRLVLSQSRGQIQQHFNVGALSDASLILPPIEIQIAFEGRINAASTVYSSMLKSQERLDTLFRSLQQRAFSGELTTERASAPRAMAG